MSKLRVLDLFSGIGGFSIGLHWAGGFETVAFCEMKPHSQAVLAKNFPGIPCHGDVTTYEFKGGEADVITAGFPCQDISFAGIGAGLAGARSGLYREVIRAVRVVRPRYALLENVAALLSRGLGTVLADLAEVGYDTEWHCIPASAVGAPHQRDRVWIVADARSEQHEGYRAPLSGTLSTLLAEAYVANACRSGHGAEDGSERDRGASPEDQGEGDQWEWLRTELGRSRAPMADPDSDRQQQSQGSLQDERRRSGDGCEAVADAECVGCQEVEQPVACGTQGAWPANQVEYAGEPSRWGWWAVEPRLGRVADGVPNRVDRLEGLGNAVVPEIPEILGLAIQASIAAQEAA